jgi:sialic acid synthase
VPAPYVIAEIGCNHGGDLELAKRMISVAARFCEVDAVKFQKRDPATLLTPEQYQAPHPEPRNAFGASYGEHREFLEFDIDQHAELAACAA